MNVEEVKEAKAKILEIIRARGPSLPVQIAREIRRDLIFTGAFLSEMLSDKKIKISKMKVGGSPLYYLPGQEPMLENFYTYLNSKEKEAFSLLKEKSILEDDLQHPAIRVALRSIKDFTIPFKFQDKLFWKFYSISEEEIKKLVYKQKKPEKVFLLEKELREVKSKEKPLGIFEEEKEGKMKKPKISFIEEVKASLLNKNIEILNIEKADKKEVLIKAKEKDKEILVFVFNKKKISDKELVKAYKKSLAYTLPYTILMKDNISKKLQDSIEASKSLIRIDKI